MWRDLSGESGRKLTKSASASVLLNKTIRDCTRNYPTKKQLQLPRKSGLSLMARLSLS